MLSLIESKGKKTKISEVSTLWRNEIEDSVFVKTDDTIDKFYFWL